MSTQVSLESLIARAEANLTAATGQSNPATKAIASAIAGVSYGQYGYQDLLFRQLHPETCSEAWLYLHANRHNTPRLLPTFAKGSVQFTELGGTVVIAKGTRLIYGDKEYETTKEQYSNVPVDVIALESGTASNLPNGAKLTLTEGLSGIDPNNILSLGIEGGADIEELEHWRARVIVAFEKNELIGKSEDYEVWAVSAHSDVDFAWALDNTPERGMVEVYIGARESDPTLSGEVVNLVQETFEANRLAGCHPFAHLPEKAPLAIEIQGIEDQAIRDDVVMALENFVKGKMGKIDPETKKPESITNTEIVLVISTVTNNFIVRSPVGEVAIDNNQIHVLGDVTWTPPT
ncbi:baseplate J/gp47 family protein [Vibrio sp. Isolate23]|uniref:baseplate J/gp47 family protein n=1 Tax=Vibrio sp. Isolate23 TaxID=2908533 RepID=UPI001EFE7B6F|nr:baseplate J/gp47 family protein [Vibrio sp. Isolate23]MCG9681226.1 baseplate J/gp47 family protein [Vibrio sp. Isolate23]